MRPNTHETPPVTADAGDNCAEAIAPLEDDCHLIDDPPEEDEAADTDSAERDKPTRLRGALDSASGTLRRGVAGIGKTAGAVGDGMVGSAIAVAGRVRDVSAQTGRLASDSLRKVPVRRLSEPLTAKAASFGNALLATDVAATLNDWTKTVFASGPATRYDKALDQFYNDTGKYGADHRLFDGSHDLVGAWKTIAETFPDEGWLQRAEGYVSALWKDMATPKGIPVVT